VPFKFECLDIWHLAVEYVDLAYGIVDQLPREEEFNLKSQLKRAATSVALNIAEGSTGQTNAEQDRFLGYALRSLLETVACMHLIRRRKYPVEVSRLDDAYKQAEVLARKVQALRKSLGVQRASQIREESLGYDV
jgi:four helix bundle protein